MHEHYYQPNSCPDQLCPPNDCPPPPCPGQHRGGEHRCEQSIIPPPVPPVRYVPGMNVQEQLCNMAERVNVSIDRWNQIQANCYKALDQVVGAAVNNDVYYAPDEVKFMEGYSEDAACPYSIVEARAVDRAGRPIFCHLRPAYNNTTNSGAQENIQNVSFVTSGQMVLTGIQATETHWKGTSFFNGNPGNSAPDDTVWICGWNRNGVLRFFRGDVGEDVLRQNRMVNAIGPVFPIIKDGQDFNEVTLGEEPGAVQAMGWKQNGNKVFFSCGMYDTPGMRPAQVRDVLKRIGCMTAVITSYQVQAATAWDASPIAGTESEMTYAGDVITAPGLTGGMTFLGKLTDAPLQWNIPANCVNWVISKRPDRGWRNSFTTEVANIVQNMGRTQNSMSSLMGQMKSENEAISKLQYDVQQNSDKIADLTVTVNTFDNRITATEARLDAAEANIAKNTADIEALQDKLDQEISTRAEQYNELVQADLAETEARQKADQQEAAERQSADAALRAAITAEESARKSADTVLQNNIDEEAATRRAEDQKLYAAIDDEATARALADRNLQAAIEAEQSARSTKDTQHEARMDAIEAQEQKDVEAINGEIDAIKDGSGLPIASETTLGAIKVGNNLTIDADGKLNAQASAGGDSIVQGTGIKITDTADGKKQVAVDTDVIATDYELGQVQTQVNNIKDEQTEQNNKIMQNELGIDQAMGRATEALTKAESVDYQVVSVDNRVTEHDNDIAALKNGSGLPIASATTLGAFKVGANLSISADGVLSSSAGEGTGGETVAQGEGISVTHDTETNVATVALNTESQAAVAAVANKADKSTVEALSTTVGGKADKTAVDAIDTRLTTAEGEIAGLQAGLDGVTETANTAATGVASLNSNVSALTNTVNTNTQNIDGLTTSVGTVNEEITKIKADLAAVDDTATAAMDHAADAEAAAAAKVSKSGDTMTGDLKLPAASLLGQLGGVSIGANATPEGNGSILLRGLNADGTPATVAPVVVRGLAAPTAPDAGANKGYVDTAKAEVAETAQSALTTAQQAESAASGAEDKANEAYILASSAETKANNAMPKTGGTFTGEIGVPSIKLTSGTSPNYNNIIKTGVSIHPSISIKGTDDTPVTGVGFRGLDGELDIDGKTNDATGNYIPVFVPAPTTAQHAANKQYVDNVGIVSGSSHFYYDIDVTKTDATELGGIYDNNIIFVMFTNVGNNDIATNMFFTDIYGSCTTELFFPKDSSSRIRIVVYKSATKVNAKIEVVSGTPTGRIRIHIYYGKIGQMQ